VEEPEGMQAEEGILHYQEVKDKDLRHLVEEEINDKT